ncbi:hypothetical protein QMG61_05400 [Cryobacterium sp. PH31-AA6]|uniref:hypothetical protein n=1 Tax=Cryobacterium sp. PH31-AA6 TaxID=3046205 RepID=UPI0024BA5CD6|nr:hypothetical protein [Cryobacterium sp. PH31-AA6]MDJ0323198.1 hypothetical protein [Cryobacterium sp. PH31-AA6]
MNFTDLAMHHLREAEEISNSTLKAEHLSKAQTYALLANADALDENTRAVQGRS